MGTVRHDPQEADAPCSSSWSRRDYLIVVALLGAAGVAYSSVVRCEFVTFDDDVYVTGNRFLRQGLTWDGMRWGLTTRDVSNWHPLVWWSFLLDYQLHELHPAGYHLSNLLWHLGSVVALYTALRSMTGAVWPSALAAALFAVHPLNVQAVAWVSERKGVISTFFWMLTLCAYAGYVRRPGLVRYGLVALCLTLGLMAKQMLVTLPLVLLLLDYWPLTRKPRDGRPWAFLVLEKVPLAALAFGAGVLTIIAQGEAGSIATFGHVSLPARLENALVSYFVYLLQALLPLELACYYPHPGDALPLWQAAAAAAGLALITGIVLRGVRRRPYLAVGWLWYVVTLLPVIGLVQVGHQAHADRYTYVPLVGIFIAVSWGLADVVRSHGQARTAALAAGLVLAGFAIMTWMHVQFWHNSVVLWDNALRVGGSNFVAHLGLGAGLAADSKQEARTHLQAAVDLHPQSLHAHTSLAIVLMDLGRWEQARAHFLEVLRLDPGERESQFSAVAHANLGIMLHEAGDRTAAAAHLDAALRLDPALERVRTLRNTLEQRDGESPVKSPK
jgi:tetratricopeptide (TPR) repeat protein